MLISRVVGWLRWYRAVGDGQDTQSLRAQTLVGGFTTSSCLSIQRFLLALYLVHGA